MEQRPDSAVGIGANEKFHAAHLGALRPRVNITAFKWQTRDYHIQ